MKFPCVVSFLALALSAPTAQAISVDGRIDPVEWQGAQHVTDFRLTQPLTRAPVPQPTEAWILATPEGLAVGFRNTQPASVPRTRQHLQRDQNAQADRVNLYVDFDGDGRAGYDFRVYLSNSIGDLTITNENQFNADWDGDWRHATSEDDAGWSVEMLIPWHLAPMRDREGGRRTLGIQLDRTIGATGERASWPAVSFSEQRYLSALNKIEVPLYRQTLLAVTPYVAAVSDLMAGRYAADAGADVFWKPNGRFQLSASINPDFSQVESDALVVNFSATETFFNEKRPFFTENQNFFDVPFGAYNGRSRLVYTRRVGAGSDDGTGQGDVTAAVKLNGSGAGFNFGLFAATEADAEGRDFQAARVTRDWEHQGVGAMITRVTRPNLDREASVLEFDHRWMPNASWSVRTAAAGSLVAKSGEKVRDTGAQARIDWDMGGGWRQQLYLLHLGDDFQMSDFGYLERNNFNLARYDLARRYTSFPEASRYRSSDWHAVVSTRYTDRGLHIADTLTLNRTGQLRNGGNDAFEIGVWGPWRDDLTTRGHGLVEMRSSLWATYDHSRPRQGDSPWSFDAGAGFLAQGVGDFAGGEMRAEFVPTYHASDRLRIFTGLEVDRDPEWLLWRGRENVLGEYRKRMLSLNAGTEWLIDDRQELRIRLESIGLDAKAKRAWNTGAGGKPQPASTMIQNFGLRSLGFQVRYRYELAPLSYLYIAYVRGGDSIDDGLGPFTAHREFRKSMELRDSEQVLVKLSYRFE
ncbi:hypothetical protein LYSHEL_21790 [Lysobacter helvus]|uniref:DUF5916 domain-containing protein n=2 Tax=Lysobacteraceae TaxID=32033 RepID=A0ABN6FX50_9GAMM|nr:MULTISPECIES: DUF5916 domain-containing protein [Lysobacter]BCT93156.1 hypothetical protein LYSCAS_21800 [Lysobacter caseinilyticus]BCT96308.1 hypothetical protein LYSHEL_21790 [Lysobacter helvus]